MWKISLFRQVRKRTRLVSLWWYEREQKELQGKMESEVKEGSDENKKEQKIFRFKK
jgi:hypothetical protein